MHNECLHGKAWQWIIQCASDAGAQPQKQPGMSPPPRSVTVHIQAVVEHVHMAHVRARVVRDTAVVVDERHHILVAPRRNPKGTVGRRVRYLMERRPRASQPIRHFRCMQTSSGKSKAGQQQKEEKKKEKGGGDSLQTIAHYMTCI
jgi:hypothetical protein